MNESYILKKEIDWSTLTSGITLPLSNRVVFGQIAGRFLTRGESKHVRICIDGQMYDAVISNENFADKFKESHKGDIVRLTYSRNSALAVKLRELFVSTWKYLSAVKNSRPKGDRHHITVPDNCKEFLALYTTEYDDTYILDAITASDVDC